MIQVDDDAIELLARVRARALVQDTRSVRRVHLVQRGEVALRPGRWLAFEARQWMDVDPPGFAWRAKVRMAPLITARVVDAFEDGHGRLDARLWGLLPVARAQGPETDAAELQRYLAELPWCPFAYVRNERLAYARTGASILRVSAPSFDAAAHVDLHLDASGDVLRAEAGQRWRREGKAMVARPWSGSFATYEERDGVRIPTRCKVRWHLPEGDVEYFRGVVTGYRVER